MQPQPRKRSRGPRRIGPQIGPPYNREYRRDEVRRHGYYDRDELSKQVGTGPGEREGYERTDRFDSPMRARPRFELPTGGMYCGAPDAPPRVSYAGKGPKGYTRSDERIREEACERLTADEDVDASDIEVNVSHGEITLKGTVPSRAMKHRAEACVEDLPSVKDVHNLLRVRRDDDDPGRLPDRSQAV
jgi:hypothetical protein